MISVRSILRKFNVKQEIIAEAIGISQPHLSAIKNGKARLTLNVAKKLSKLGKYRVVINRSGEICFEEKK